VERAWRERGESVERAWREGGEGVESLYFLWFLERPPERANPVCNQNPSRLTTGSASHTQHTTARRRWVGERLGMGDERRVTQAIGRVERDGHPELERLKSQWEQLYESSNGEVEL
jgi:hypothetical protein